MAPTATAFRIGTTILLSDESDFYSQFVFIDFGIAGQIISEEYRSDPKKAHDGTVDYTSRDAHGGALTRRGDLEIMAYDLFQRLGNRLPWEENQSSPATVQQQKINFIENRDQSKPNKLSESLTELFLYIRSISNISAEHTSSEWMLSLQNPQRSLCSHQTGRLDEFVRKFWEIEGPVSQQTARPDEQVVEEHFYCNTFRQSDGRYIVSLPFSQLSHLPSDLKSTYSLAIRGPSTSVLSRGKVLSVRIERQWMCNSKKE